MNLRSTSAISYQHLIPFAEMPDPDNETLTEEEAGDADLQDDESAFEEDNDAPDPNIRKTDEEDDGEEEEDFILSEDEDIAGDDDMRTDEEISGSDGVI